MMNHTKYKPFPKFSFPQRTWPDKEITKAPTWCSSDLRDGNQALEIPMSLEQKLEFFQLLIKMGFKEIEVGFPSASDTEFNLVRTLIERKMIPDDVSIQVLTQARDHLIERTFESLEGVNNAIVHFYNSTSPLHRNVVFGMDRSKVKEMAVHGAQRLAQLAETYGPERFRFEYSPECFTDTEMDYALEICNAVLDVWKPTPDRKAIINLPSTVELATANVYADQIEYMSTNIRYRDSVEISLHAHNDRGCGVAASELAIMAGADRVEGTLFGNGERTGNMDIVTLALNMYTHGVDPKLDFSDIDGVVDFYEQVTGLAVPPRHPYAGKLVYTAFSGSHQDAIKKGFASLGEHYQTWKMPYLTIDPADVGRSYEAIIRINSQSGKGGVFYILEQKYGITPPKTMQPQFSALITQVSDQGHKELMADEIYQLFEREYINITTPVELKKYRETTSGDRQSHVEADIVVRGEAKQISGDGTGLMDAFCSAISRELGVSFDIKHYSEHSLEHGTGSKAITYMHITDKAGNAHFGAGISASISKSSLRALVSAINKMV